MQTIPISLLASFRSLAGNENEYGFCQFKRFSQMEIVIHCDSKADYRESHDHEATNDQVSFLVSSETE